MDNGQTGSSDEDVRLIVTSFRRSRGQSDDAQRNPSEAFLATSHSQSTALTTLLYSIAYPNSSRPRDDVPLRLLENGKYNHDVSQSTYNLSQPIPNFAELRHHEAVVEYEQHHSLDLVFDVAPSPDSKLFGRPIRLALFDMDSTLINEEVIDELARSIGISDAVSAITARAMNGDINFATSLKERVSMLKGVNSNIWTDLRRTVTITEGARELVAGLKKRGALTGVISGGFTPMAEWLKEELGLDYAFANHNSRSTSQLPQNCVSRGFSFISDKKTKPRSKSQASHRLADRSQLLTAAPIEEHPYEHLSGLLSPGHPIITPELKRETLIALATAHQIPLSETMAVGDGSNDLLMLHKAGLGVAWNAKERVQKSAPMRLNGRSLADLLCLLGAEK